MKKRFLLSILLSFLILIAACSIPLRFPVPAGDTISVFYGTGEEECHYLLEPGTEAYERVCDLLGDLRFHLSLRAGIQLTPPQKDVENNRYGIIGYYGEAKGNVLYLVSSNGFLQFQNHSFAIGHYGDNKATLWLEALQLALEDVEPDSKEVWSISQKAL